MWYALHQLVFSINTRIKFVWGAFRYSSVSKLIYRSEENGVIRFRFNVVDHQAILVTLLLHARTNRTRIASL